MYEIDLQTQFTYRGLSSERWRRATSTQFCYAQVSSKSKSNTMYYNNKKNTLHIVLFNWLYSAVASQLLKTEGIECYVGDSGPKSNMEKKDCGNANFCVNITGSMLKCT